MYDYTSDYHCMHSSIINSPDEHHKSSCIPLSPQIKEKMLKQREPQEQEASRKKFSELESRTYKFNYWDYVVSDCGTSGSKKMRKDEDGIECPPVNQEFASSKSLPEHRVWCNVATVFHSSNNLEKAEQALRKAIKLSDHIKSELEFSIVKFNLAILLEQKGDCDRSKHNLEELKRKIDEHVIKEQNSVAKQFGIDLKSLERSLQTKDKSEQERIITNDVANSPEYWELQETRELQKEVILMLARLQIALNKPASGLKILRSLDGSQPDNRPKLVLQKTFNTKFESLDELECTLLKAEAYKTRDMEFAIQSLEDQKEKCTGALEELQNRLMEGNANDQEMIKAEIAKVQKLAGEGNIIINSNV
jgi:hypothetical protein